MHTAVCARPRAGQGRHNLLLTCQMFRAADRWSGMPNVGSFCESMSKRSPGGTTPWSFLSWNQLKQESSPQWTLAVLNIQHSLSLAQIAHSDRLMFIHLLTLSSHVYRKLPVACLPSGFPSSMFFKSLNYHVFSSSQNISLSRFRFFSSPLLIFILPRPFFIVFPPWSTTYSFICPHLKSFVTDFSTRFYSWEWFVS